MWSKRWRRNWHNKLAYKHYLRLVMLKDSAPVDMLPGAQSEQQIRDALANIYQHNMSYYLNKLNKR